MKSFVVVWMPFSRAFTELTCQLGRNVSQASALATNETNRTLFSPCSLVIMYDKVFVCMVVVFFSMFDSFVQSSTINIRPGFI